MNLWLKLDNCLSVAQLVRALHQNRRAAGFGSCQRAYINLYSKIPSARKPSTTISFIERDAPKISKLINCRFLCLNNRKRIKTTRMPFVWKLIDYRLFRKIIRAHNAEVLIESCSSIVQTQTAATYTVL